MDAIEYRMPVEGRIYVLRGDVDRGIDTMGTEVPYLRMPTATAPDALRRLGIGADKSWSSLRIEDLGHCALFFSWRALAQAFNGGVETALVDSGNFGASAEVLGTGGRSNLGPILRRAGTFEAIDEIRYNGRIEAESAGGCAPLFLDFETRFQLLPSGELRPLAAAVEVEGECATEAPIEAGVAQALSTALPTGFAAALGLVTRFEPREVNVPRFICSVGEEPACASPLRGSGSTCGGGSESNVCDVRVDLDRAFVVPEGVVLVYAQDTSDPQLPFVDDALGDVIFEHLGIDRDGAAALRRAHFGCEPDPVRQPFTIASRPDPENLVVEAVVDPEGL